VLDFFTTRFQAKGSFMDRLLDQVVLSEEDAHLD
jgi:hypothetical protein